ncbi:hypothetical protein QE397_000044 [Rhodococcus sp. SORGH_AS 301]|nr:hypothetical protein [Rhodococcus sp. SORGH_AS_0301]
MDRGHIPTRRHPHVDIGFVGGHEHVDHVPDGSAVVEVGSRLQRPDSAMSAAGRDERRRARRTGAVGGVRPAVVRADALRVGTAPSRGSRSPSAPHPRAGEEPEEMAAELALPDLYGHLAGEIVATAPLLQLVDGERLRRARLAGKPHGVAWEAAGPARAEWGHYRRDGAHRWCGRWPHRRSRCSPTPSSDRCSHRTTTYPRKRLTLIYRPYPTGDATKKVEKQNRVPARHQLPLRQDQAPPKRESVSGPPPRPARRWSPAPGSSPTRRCSWLRGHGAAPCIFSGQLDRLSLEAPSITVDGADLQRNLCPNRPWPVASLRVVDARDASTMRRLAGPIITSGLCRTQHEPLNLLENLAPCVRERLP